MRPRRLHKTLRQATLRRRAAFYVLAQANEPDEELVDPSSKRYEETLLSLLRRPAHPRGAHVSDPDQLDLWVPAARPRLADPDRPYQPRRLG